uniref:Large ribosomal subunit protein eL14 n=1 Tax=Mesocestoides corti TaxID=53468 RepID=A0A5K3EGM2_MESCO
MVHYTRFVQVGRVVFITHGPFEKKIAVIVDIIDQNRVLIDGPCSGVPRRPINIKRLHLTKIVMKLPHKCGTHGVADLWHRQKVDRQWNKTKWARKLEKKRIRASLNDFQRFQVMVARKKQNRVISGFRMRKSTLGTLAKMRPKKASN